MVDAPDLGSGEGKTLWGFKSPPSHCFKMQRDITLKEKSKTEVVIDGSFVLDEGLLRNEIMRLGSGAKIKGFRPGKAPYEILKNMFYERSKSNVVRNTINEILIRLSQDKNIKFVGKPNISWTDSGGGIISFSVISERLPELDIKNYKGVKVRDPNIKITDEEFKNTIEMVRESYSFVEDTDKEVPDEGDLVLADIIITSSNGKVEKHEEELFDLSKQNEWLKKVLLSMKVGEQKNINISNDMYDNAKVKIILHKVKRKISPSTDEELAKSAGFEKFEDFAEDVKKRLEERRKEREEYYILNSIIVKLAEENEVEVPKSMVEEEISYLKSRNRTMGISSSDDLIKIATFNVLRRIILEHVARKEEMNVTDDEVQNFINDISKREGVPVEKIKSRLDEKDMKDIEIQVLCKKAERLLIDTAEVSS